MIWLRTVTHQLTYIVDLQLAHNIGAVSFNCLNTDAKRQTDFPAVLTLG